MENLLIDLWQENIDDLRGVRKNSHVYMEMAQTMKEGCDLDVGWTEVRTKVENLTKKYRMEKNKVGPSGGASSGWQHFEKYIKIWRYASPEELQLGSLCPSSVALPSE
ncbi:uncharacterized protein LOC111078541 [Drosophila obscura]|uniref:uncharacterized protein LOC111078541 n=1 Tax=Drosophila obscura TaxID=7282 RepID=UPI000B9FA54A|nr:uncharacterized protein LOC111078541 [Drosophila obscura]